MYYGFVTVLIAVSLVDIFFHRGVGVAPMALLYVGLKIQADRAADLLFKRGLSRPVSDLREPSWMPSPEEDPFATPLQDSLRLEAPKAEKKREEPRAAKKATPRPQAKPSPAAPAKPKEPFRLPKFHGAPHEVLGIESDANTNVIVKAFRHWIKEYHPDHLKAGQEMRRATERARTITSAKESLLDRRRQMRKAA